MVADNALLNLTKRDADVAIRPSRDPPESLVGRKITNFTVAIYRYRDQAAVESRALAESDWDHAG